MQLHIGKSAITAGATSDANRFLQYPVMSTLRPAYPRGPGHYKNMHQLLCHVREHCGSGTGRSPTAARTHRWELRHHRMARHE